MRVGRILRSPAIIAAVVSTTVTLTIGGVVALASIPDAQGYIHGCYDNQSGALRVIDDATQTCAAGETAIQWRRDGVSGITAGFGLVGGGNGAVSLSADTKLLQVRVDGSCKTGAIASIGAKGGVACWRGFGAREHRFTGGQSMSNGAPQTIMSMPVGTGASLVIATIGLGTALEIDLGGTGIATCYLRDLQGNTYDANVSSLGSYAEGQMVLVGTPHITQDHDAIRVMCGDNGPPNGVDFESGTMAVTPLGV
jgi:hypothetical protein